MQVSAPPPLGPRSPESPSRTTAPTGTKRPGVSTGPQVVPGFGLERDVVFAAARRGTDRLPLLGLVRGGRARGVAVLRLGAEELNAARDDLDLLALAAAVFGLPLAPVEPAFDRNRPT